MNLMNGKKNQPTFKSKIRNVIWNKSRLKNSTHKIKITNCNVKEKDLSIKMSKDIDEMENMLNDYLQFAKTQSHEETIIINLPQLIDEIRKNINSENLKISYSENVSLNCRPIALKRSFENIIQNGLIYGKKFMLISKKLKSCTCNL